MGIVILILGAKLRGSEIFKSADAGSEAERLGDAAFYIMIIFASLAIAVAILGVITAKCNKCFCIGCVSTFH